MTTPKCNFGSFFIVSIFASCLVFITVGRSIRWAVYVACMEEIRNAYKILVWKAEGRRPLGKPRPTWEVTLKWILNKCYESMWA